MQRIGKVFGRFREIESTTHALWSCPSAMDVWNQGPRILQKGANSAGAFIDLVEKLLAASDQNLMELFSMTARAIWMRRNTMVFEDSFIHPTQIAKQAALALAAFKESQSGTKKMVQLSQDHLSVWASPPVNFIKINWDAALSVSKNKTGFGLVARDHAGSILATKKLSKSGVVEPLLAEALGGLYAVGMAKDLGLQSIILEGDSQTVIQGIQQATERWDSVGLILKDIRILLLNFKEWRVAFVRRSGNQVAHCLAKESLELAEDGIELVYGPVL